MDGQAGLDGPVKNALEPVSVVRGSDNGYSHTSLSQEPCNIDHGDHVALRHEREENKVKRRRTLLGCFGSHEKFCKLFSALVWLC